MQLCLSPDVPPINLYPQVSRAQSQSFAILLKMKVAQKGVCSTLRKSTAIVLKTPALQPGRQAMGVSFLCSPALQLARCLSGRCS